MVDQGAYLLLRKADAKVTREAHSSACASRKPASRYPFARAVAALDFTAGYRPGQQPICSTKALLNALRLL